MRIVHALEHDNLGSDHVITMVMPSDNDEESIAHPGNHHDGARMVHLLSDAVD